MCSMNIEGVYSTGKKLLTSEDKMTADFQFCSSSMGLSSLSLFLYVSVFFPCHCYLVFYFSVSISHRLSLAF